MTVKRADAQKQNVAVTDTQKGRHKPHQALTSGQVTIFHITATVHKVE